MTLSMTQRPVYAIAGPTASGKTVLAVAFAKHLGGEVVNFDSVQIYREIEIATAKPSAAEMRGVPHHLLDYVDPRVNYTAADWARDAEKKIAEIESRGNVVVLVGGTGFYLRTLMHPLFESPQTDASLRQRLQRLNERKGPEHLHRILSRLDPQAAGGLFPKDYVRVIRAIEVFLQTGELISDRQTDRPPASEVAGRTTLMVLSPPRGELYRLIDRRTENHFAAGLADEVKQIRTAGVSDSSNALGAHGYRRVCEYLRGERTLESAVERTKQDVRNYAKRQLTWFRAERGAHWLDGFGTSDEIVETALRIVRQQT